MDFAWFSGFDVRKNGNVVVANWRGHGYKGNGPHRIEFDADNRIVWTWAGLGMAKCLTNAMVLESPSRCRTTGRHIALFRFRK